jgi:hypothetical protein
MPVKAVIDAPDCVLLPKSGKTVSLDIGAKLINERSDDVVLTLDTTGDVMFWHLFDANQKEIQRMPAVGKPTVSKDGTPVMEKRVPRGETVAVPETLELDAGKLKDGQRYFLRVRVWGFTVEHEFKAVGTDKAPKAAKDPAPGVPKAKKGGGKAKKAA